MAFPFYKQLDHKDSGPACLLMIAKYYGKIFSYQFFREKCNISKNALSLQDLSRAIESIGFKSISAKVSYTDLVNKPSLPCIVQLNNFHFIVIFKINKSHIWIADPQRGLTKLANNDFISNWLEQDSDQVSTGVVLFVEPTANFKNYNSDEIVDGRIKIRRIASYFVKYKSLFFQIFLSFVIGSSLQLVLPFLTQSIVDIGIGSSDKNFILLILIGQTAIILGSSVVEFVRSYILMHISTRVNISLLTDFIIKLMKLPLSYFDTKIIGDIMQRMNDHSRIQSFLTDNVLSFAFTLINFIIYSVIIVTYDGQLFIVFIVGSAIYILWILMFLRFRKKIDYTRFSLISKSQSATIQMVQGMQDIKLSNSEIIKRWGWERLQAKTFRLNLKSLTVTQVQSAGAVFLNQSKNAFITYLTATKVVDGTLTIGGMLAIQFIIGQLNGPIQQIITFTQSLQDAKISLDRINEIHSIEIEEPESKHLLQAYDEDSDIQINNLYYQYPGMENNFVLKNLDLVIPKNKTTAIVGMSGSGKTTLIKLLLRFYEPSRGDISIGATKLSNISHSYWRSQCGVVLQEGFIFSTTIAENIAPGDEYPDIEKVIAASELANAREFIESLPSTFQTKIGAGGMGLSQGQKQRILIARAIYKNPSYVFFDEATNALDANNEMVIMQKFDSFFKNRTAVIVAHRLSTVKNCDQIIVLDKGTIVEKGTHDQLIDLKGNYYNLVKNQLAIGQ